MARVSRNKKKSTALLFLKINRKQLSWLRNNGLGDVIKNDITVTFGRGEDNKAAAYADLAKGQGLSQFKRLV